MDAGLPSGKEGGTAMKSWCETENNRLLAENLVVADISDELDAFIEKLHTLESVPYEYLVCTDDLLPSESVRFFSVDETWVDCLVDGAMSVGRATQFDLKHDAALKKHLLQRFRMKRGKAAAEEDPVRTGFLLRSQLVSGWPSLVIRCYSGSGEDKKLLSCERMDKIGNETLLCIADGIIGCVEFIEPTESVCFGFVEEAGKFRLPVSVLPPVEVGKSNATGFQRKRNSCESIIEVPFRDGIDGVVDVQGLAEAIAKAQNIDVNTVSALEYSAELLETPMLYRIKGGLQ